MELPAILFTLLAAILLFRLPRDWAALPLLVGATYMTLGQQIEIGPFHFNVIRILIAVGAVRVLVKGERICGAWKPLDRLMFWWAAWAICSSCFHKSFSETLVAHLGLVYDALGLYFLLRIFIEDIQGLSKLGKIIIILLAPVAVEMIAEHFRGRNLFAVFGGVGAESEVRNGKIRAQGPFAHSILAGTVGAVCWPMALIFWKNHRTLAVLGLFVTCSIVLTSSSSGPIMTSAFVLLGLAFWKLRSQMQLVRWAAIFGILALDMVMKAPVYYLLARIDLTGSSTGWHRAELIHAALTHIGEWWVAGTDYTRHWMPYGVPWSEDQADITNQYIKMGVLGGLPLMFLFIGILSCGFAAVGKALVTHRELPSDQQFLIWSLGAILFGHAVTFLSVSYFDQSVVFFYLILGAIGSLPDARAFPAYIRRSSNTWQYQINEPNLYHYS
jgi:hypothetical protein